jgi:hypothetical protein
VILGENQEIFRAMIRSTVFSIPGRKDSTVLVEALV